ncbi:MAG: hypothetical protein JRH11_02125 [Deltaproteobacteria bacterium]|nr:hypothetical protein [Deltaproteobacteria bacterium]
MRIVTALVVAASFLGGCLYQNMSPATKLRDSVEAGNEGARWGRMDIAYERIAPEYVRDYARRHYDWGDGIQMADLDILRLEMAEDEDSANVTVAFGWYDYDTMILHRTVVRQKWRSTGSGYFVLFEEEIIDGSDQLLEPEEEDEEEEDEALAEGDQDEDDEDDDEGWVDQDDEAVAEDLDADDDEDDEDGEDDDDDEEVAADDDDDDGQLARADRTRRRK